MSIKRLSLAALLAASLVGCSSGSTTVASPPGSPQAGSTSALSTSVPSTSVPSTSKPVSPGASSASAAAVPGGGATDFCSAYAELQKAVDSETPQIQGNAFRAAATDMRKFAPAAIKQAAGLFADVVDEVGQAIASGKPNPGTFGAGQSADRIKAIADTITWVTSNCQ